MTLEEQFDRLLEKECVNELKPFLKELQRDQKKALVPHIKKLNKEYLEHIPITKGSTTTFKKKATDAQSKMLAIASFVCFNRVDFQKSFFGAHVLHKDVLNNILEWYCPTWFADYINGLGSTRFVPYTLNYLWLIELAERGFVTPVPELIVKLLPQTIFDFYDRKNHYLPENLLKHKQTLDEHIWYLFQYESAVHWVDKYRQFDQATIDEGYGWIHALKRFSNEGKIDRKRLLRESILATTRNFNKTLTGSFAELLLQLEPAKEELLDLQRELFTMFNSPQSKPLNTALNCLKKITDDKRFDFNTFLDHAAVLLSSETKSVLSSALTILEKIAKKQKDKHEAICEAVCQAFLSKDEEIQTKAARLIQKLGSPSMEGLKKAINHYHDSILTDPRQLLVKYLITVSEEDVPAVEVPDALETTSAINDQNSIIPLTNIDDLVFLASQAFDNNESYHFDLLPAFLINLQDDIRGENITRLEAAFKSAYQLTINFFSGSLGFLDNMLACFFVDYIKFLIEAYPAEAKTLKAMHEKFTGDDKANRRAWFHYNTPSLLKDWKAHDKRVIYEPFKQLLLVSLNKLTNQNKLPLLSTPTHHPGWISPHILIDRLREYQLQNVQADDMDFQIAVSRCALENSEDALNYANEKLNGEYLHLIKFLLDKNAKPEGSLKHESLWMIAGITKAPNVEYEAFKDFSYYKLNRTYLTGQFKWRPFKENYTYQQYDHPLGKYKDVPATRQILRLQSEDERKPEPALKNLVNKLLRQKESNKLIYEYLSQKAGFLTSATNDIKRLLMIIPNNPEPLIAHVVNNSLKFSTFCEADDKKLVVATLQTMHEIWGKQGNMAHLFLATCMLCSDKTAASFAAEIWINGALKGTVDSKLIGEIIGVHQRVEFAPLKRFTDLIMGQMFKVSNQLNSELEKLLTSLLRTLPDEPIKNLKKLLEIYSQVLSVNNSLIKDDILKQQLVKWKAAAGLSKVIARLEQMMAEQELV